VPELLTVEQALDAILEHAPASTETVALEERSDGSPGAGSVRRRPPPFPSSAMDGFAVRQRRRRASCRSPFASPRAAPPGPLRRRRGRHRDGGTVPDGADAVVPVEVVEDRGDADRSGGAAPVSTCGRAAATSARRRRRRAGERLGAVQIGASRRRGRDGRVLGAPRVAVLATGTSSAPGERSSRADLRVEPRMIARPRGSGAGPSAPGRADDEDSHRARIERGSMRTSS
jgi:molybdopterin biosynthesis enzyme